MNYDGLQRFEKENGRLYGPSRSPRLRQNQKKVRSRDKRLRYQSPRQARAAQRLKPESQEAPAGPQHRIKGHLDPTQENDRAAQVRQGSPGKSRIV